MILQAIIGDREIRLDVRSSDGRPQVTLEEHAPDLDLAQLSPYSYSLLIDGRSHLLHVRPSGDGYEVALRQHTYYVRLRDELDLTIERLGMKNASADASGRVVAPIPGLVTSVAVSEGDRVAVGEPLLILEAMKMENEITAPMTGIVAAVHVAPGTAVEKGAPLVELGGN